MALLSDLNSAIGNSSLKSGNDKSVRSVKKVNQVKIKIDETSQFNQSINLSNGFLGASNFRISNEKI
jgi:hypothetical protein